MNAPANHRTMDIASAAFHLRRALAYLDEAGELSAAPHAQMALDTLDLREGAGDARVGIDG